MIKNRLENLIYNKRTLLGVGPMSRNCIDASIELGNEYNVPIMLIASRRQIDSEEFGGGYVNNWTTEQFVDYIFENDKQGHIIVARDHGGPWQSVREVEARLGLRKAMESAKHSFKADIAAGIQIIHIDPSIDIHGAPTLNDIIDRLFELYEYCVEEAQRQNREVIFEIGTEEQSGTTDSTSEFEELLSEVMSVCKKNRLPKPFFVVAQNGTKVMETHNVGSFDCPIRISDEIPPEIQVPIISDVCEKYGIFMKAHNTDYLSDESLQWYPRLGIHAANVAPEFGVAETRALVCVLHENNLLELEKRFLRLSFESGKWKKWMMPATAATEYDQAIIAGHYIFATDECEAIKLQATIELKRKGIELDTYLKQEVKNSILRYLVNFRLVR